MSYAATASILALCVDLSRLPVYLFYRPNIFVENWSFALVLVISAVLGARLGKIWLNSLKTDFVNKFVTIGIIASGVYYIHMSLA